MISVYPFSTYITDGNTVALTSSSTNRQIFTGTLNETVTLPDVTSTMLPGMDVLIENNSTGVIYVQTSTAIALYTVPSKAGMKFTVLSTSSNAASSWRLTNIDSPGQFVATTTNDSASSGCMSYISGPISRLRSNSLTLTSNTTANICTTPSLTLNSGMYMIHPMGGFSSGLLTTLTELSIAVSATSATLPSTDTMSNSNTNGELWMKAGFSALVIGATDYCMQLTPFPISIALGQTKTLYLVARGVFGVSTLSVFGSLQARCIR